MSFYICILSAQYSAGHSGDLQYPLVKWMDEWWDEWMDGGLCRWMDDGQRDGWLGECVDHGDHLHGSILTL